MTVILIKWEHCWNKLKAT